MKKVWSVCLGVAMLALLAVPAGAAEGIESGADLWHSVTGYTFSSFTEDPIPAGFFCPSSKPFSGIIQLEGSPLATAPAGALGDIDTIVRRLDKGVFNEKGEATTRIQLMALSLASVKPIETECGQYDVTASLGGEQPVTEMKIVRTSDDGGFYVAPLELNVKVVFTPVSGKGERRELTHRVSLGPGHQSYWAYNRGSAAKVAEAARRTGTIKVDTDGDLAPDTLVPALGNFVAGFDPAAIASPSPELCKAESCHCARWMTAEDGDPYVPNWYCVHLHCVTVWIRCDKPIEKIRYGPIPVDPTGVDEAEPIGHTSLSGNTTSQN
ncbi:MAG TPA: hypothetical protein VF789_01110 [Thermoanaerobaculia bacterium]